MTYADNRELRKKLAIAFGEGFKTTNLTIKNSFKIAKLRLNVQLLGYNSRTLCIRRAHGKVLKSFRSPNLLAKQNQPLKRVCRFTGFRQRN
jgi:hypothetical protein